MRSFYDLMGVPPSGFDPDRRFVTSWLLPPILLASWHTLFAVYCFTTIFYTWAWEGTHHDVGLIGESFSYFTNLTYWGISFYALVAGVHTFVYSAKGYAWLYRWPRPLQVLHTLYYTTIVTFPFLVSLVYWIILYSPPWFPIKYDAWLNISRHALNSVFALLEITLTATSPPPWLHLIFLWIILLCYLAVAYITAADEHFYVYHFLDPATGSGKVTGYCFGIFAAIIVIFLIVWVLIWIRRRFTGAGKKSKRDASRQPMYGDTEMSYDIQK